MPAGRGVCEKRGNQSYENRYLNAAMVALLASPLGAASNGAAVRVEGGTIERAAVKTASDIPKGKIFDCMKEIRAVKVAAPVHIGDVIIDDCAGTGIAVVASKNVERA